MDAIHNDTFWVNLPVGSACWRPKPTGKGWESEIAESWRQRQPVGTIPAPAQHQQQGKTITCQQLELMECISPPYLINASEQNGWGSLKMIWRAGTISLPLEFVFLSGMRFCQPCETTTFRGDVLDGTWSPARIMCGEQSCFYRCWNSLISYRPRRVVDNHGRELLSQKTYQLFRLFVFCRRLPHMLC